MLRPLVLVALACLPALAACRGPVATSPNGAAVPGARMTPTPQAASIAATRDQSFTVVLEGHGSAGYEWSLAEGYDTRVVRPKGEKRYGDLGANPLPGTSASEIFEFQAVAAGQATLVFVNKRPWEAPGPTDEKRQITVTVR